MGSCGGTFVKLMLSIFNIILFILGLFIAYCGYIIFDKQKLNQQELSAIIQTNFKTGSIVLIGVGGLIVLIAILGIVGACMENTTILDSYGYIIFFMVITEMILFYYSFKYKANLASNLETGVKKAIKHYDTDSTIAFALQILQNTFQCCGYESPQDYSNMNGNVPSSCCGQMSKVTVNNPRETCPVNNIVFKQGCKHSPFLEKTLGSITYTAYALVLLQLIVILSACCLSRDIRSY